MIKRIDDRLKQRGYLFLRVKPKEAGVYYRYVDGCIRVVVGFCGHENFVLNEQQLEKIFSDLQELFFHSAGKLDGVSKDTEVTEVRIWAFVITDEPNRYRKLCMGRHPVLLCDTAEKRLFVYENWQEDAEGLEALLQEVLEEEEKEDRDTGSDGRRFPLVTIGIIAVNLLVFLALTLIGDTEDVMFMMEHGAMYPQLVVSGGEWYRLFTCMFLHFGIEHLMNNMVMLAVAGTQLERALGKIKFLLLYLLSGLGGSILSLYMMQRTEDIAVSAGASGAVFGIIGALLWVAIRNHGRFENLTTKGVLFMIALSLYFGFTSTGIDNWGHVGGVAVGFILSILFYHSTCVVTSDKLY